MTESRGLRSQLPNEKREPLALCLHVSLEVAVEVLVSADRKQIERAAAFIDTVAKEIEFTWERELADANSTEIARIGGPSRGLLQVASTCLSISARSGAGASPWFC